MAITEQSVSLNDATLRAIQSELTSAGVEGWLLYDFRGCNPIAGGLLGLPGLTRRYLVFIPSTGRPVAITHRIEQQPWVGWIGENRPYSTWRELDEALSAVLAGRRRIAMEYSQGDGVPYVDRIPAGVLELVRANGVEVVTSADLVSAFYARWSEDGLAGHRRAAVILRDVAHRAFERVGETLGGGGSLTEWDLREWVREELIGGGLNVGADAIVAVNANAANPHYAPSPEAHADIGAGDLLLIDLWGKENDSAIYADQTWMAYVGSDVPARVQEIWSVLRKARTAAVDFLLEQSRGPEPVSGYQVDDAARRVIEAAGLGEHFIHRTGHSIDTELHGSGPNIDNFETRDTRRLIAGVGFSIEPGIYLTGDIGFRSEINVFMSPEGPEVTTPDPQDELVRIDVAAKRT